MCLCFILWFLLSGCLTRIQCRSNLSRDYCRSQGRGYRLETVELGSRPVWALHLTVSKYSTSNLFLLKKYNY
ncbi:hypothetical protein F5Y17DRAFT_400597 [Xylariaceae sp. FL0594]|nr:hypothetical protein F5Y17DRAFT_400597 [Xylariaceae sp. FL0594]